MAIGKNDEAGEESQCGWMAHEEGIYMGALVLMDNKKIKTGGYTEKKIYSSV
jgi:hypothetical protein